MGPYYDHQVGRFERLDPWQDHETMLGAHAKRAPMQWPRCSARSGRD
jgi:hypothetical protein